jgi:hypothetical protein
VWCPQPVLEFLKLMYNHVVHVIHAACDPDVHVTRLSWQVRVVTSDGPPGPDGAPQPRYLLCQVGAKLQLATKD